MKTNKQTSRPRHRKEESDAKQRFLPTAKRKVQGRLQTMPCDGDHISRVHCAGMDGAWTCCGSKVLFGQLSLGGSTGYSSRISSLTCDCECNGDGTINRPELQPSAERHSGSSVESPLRKATKCCGYRPPLCRFGEIMLCTHYHYTFELPALIPFARGGTAG